MTFFLQYINVMNSINKLSNAKVFLHSYLGSIQFDQDVLFLNTLLIQFPDTTTKVFVSMTWEKTDFLSYSVLHWFSY